MKKKFKSLHALCVFCNFANEEIRITNYKNQYLKQKWQNWI